ncbi:AN1-type zinc finger protein 2B, putative [Rhizoctonia solani AG-3 Rhs1AP]|uniref:AN1-type zinc finger protein 2B, putative n=1 Tax=Rhizoctonia solani AG-3 Rhs1AP TaxID=1086054 RepID=X8JBI6_9AGAM|nr:AN1-type zinc finger protein 2B, putative [Rhizoctonia solani AG-3 Rhs1AP]
MFSPAMATRKGSTDAQMMFVGSACSLPGCSLHDFLPLKCNLCSDTFCSDHFKPNEHTCPKFDPSTADRIAPSCPLCDTPVSVPLGRDVNDVMDNHIMKECTAAGNRKSARPANRCPAPRCNKVMYAPIRCDNCRKEFCPSHRFPKQHICTASTPLPTPAPTQPTMSKLAEKFSSAGIRPGQSGPSTSAAMAAISRAAAIAKPTPAQAKRGALVSRRRSVQTYSAEPVQQDRPSCQGRTSFSVESIARAQSKRALERS